MWHKSGIDNEIDYKERYHLQNKTIKLTVIECD